MVHMTLLPMPKRFQNILQHLRRPVNNCRCDSLFVSKALKPHRLETISPDKMRRVADNRPVFFVSRSYDRHGSLQEIQGRETERRNDLSFSAPHAQRCQIGFDKPFADQVCEHFLFPAIPLVFHTNATDHTKSSLRGSQMAGKQMPIFMSTDEHQMTNTE